MDPACVAMGIEEIKISNDREEGRGERDEIDVRML
jgi:hypothetical protein